MSEEQIAKSVKSKRENAEKRGYWYSKETLKKRSKSMKGKNTGPHSLERRRKQSEAQLGIGKGRRQSPEWIAKRTASFIAGNHSGANAPGYGRTKASCKRIYFDIPNQGRVCLRSSWEAIMAQYLVDKHVDFRYEYKRFILDAKTYLQDFYLVKENKFIEVKGFMSDDAKQKLSEMKRFYPDVKVELVMKDEIKKIKQGVFAI
jgi:hypothetical protein